MIGLKTKHTDCRIIFKLYPICLYRNCLVIQSQILFETSIGRGNNEHIHVNNPSYMIKMVVMPIYCYQRIIGPENAYLKPDLGALSHNEKTLTLNTHTRLIDFIDLTLWTTTDDD